MQFAPGPGGDSPAPAPSTLAYTGARGAQVTQTEAEEVNPASWRGVWQSDSSDICFTAYLCKGGGHSTEIFKFILKLSLQVGMRTCTTSFAA